MAFGLTAVSLLLLFAVTFVMNAQENKLITVTDIKFCDEAQFSMSQKICLGDQEEFPADIKKIYTSFKINNAPKDLAFERRWYRNGEEFKRKASFYDEAWSGYTYLYNPNTHDPGSYVMRVIISDKSTTGVFSVLDN